MQAVLIDPSFYAGIVVGICALLISALLHVVYKGRS